MTNNSEVEQDIANGDRIAQGGLVKKEEYILWEIMEAPTQKTDRVGGLGSTGVAVFNPEDIQYTIAAEEPIKRGRGRPKKVA